MQFIDICTNFAQTLLPQACILCGASSGNHAACPACIADLPLHQHSACPVCALPTPQAEICGNCLQHPPFFDATISAFDYAFPADTLLRALKYRGHLQIAELVARCLAQKLIARSTPDLIIPMPLHPRRLQERGFNQAVEIARSLARILKTPLATDIALRVRVTSRQAGLPLNKRKRNIRGAFASAQELSGKRIAVVDDVMTSGASLDELAKTLKAAGAASVECWIAARTQKD